MGLFTAIFGGDRSSESSSSKSYNTNNDWLRSQLGGSVGYVPQAGGALSAMLGLGGDTAGQARAFDAFKNSIGYQNMLDTGISAVKGGTASQGLFNSGATGKALATFGQNLANQTYGSYMDRLLGLGKLGTESASIISDAGKVQESQSQGKTSRDTGAFGSFLGGLLS